MLGLSPSIKISISSKSGHSTFVLSTIDMQHTKLQLVFDKMSKGLKTFIDVTTALTSMSMQNL